MRWRVEKWRVASNCACWGAFQPPLSRLANHAAAIASISALFALGFMLGFSPFISRINANRRAKYRQSKNTYSPRQLALDGALVKPKTLCGLALCESLDPTQPYDVPTFLLH